MAFEYLTNVDLDKAKQEYILWLEEKGFLDEEAYAAALAGHYSARGYGAGRLKQAHCACGDLQAEIRSCPRPSCRPAPHPLSR